MKGAGRDGGRSARNRPRALVQAVRRTLGLHLAPSQAAALEESFARILHPAPAADRGGGRRSARGDESPDPDRGFARSRIVGAAAAVRAMFARLERIAPTDATVLILGESGTGKDLVARAVHDLSRRRGGPFVTQNCSAIAESLLETELFGHVRGAFTSAVADHKGLFEAADGGTLFLDEVADMSAGLQAKLLRVIEDSTFVPVGSAEARRADVRVVTATNRDLAALVREGRFREDLFHRLSVLTIEVPPLRDRREDIPALVDHFLAGLAERYGGSKRLTGACMRRLAAYDWPGNVRELRHEIERLWVLSGGEIEVGEEHLSPEITAAAPSARPPRGAPGRGLRREVEALERDRIMDALRRTDGNRTRAAALLGISRRNLIRKIAKLDVGG